MYPSCSSNLSRPQLMFGAILCLVASVLILLVFGHN